MKKGNFFVIFKQRYMYFLGVIIKFWKTNAKLSFKVQAKKKKSFWLLL